MGKPGWKNFMAERPEFAMELAVKGMLPKNTLGRTAITRLKVFAGQISRSNTVCRKTEKGV